MRAALVTEYGDVDDDPLTVTDRPAPDPGPGEAAIAVEAAGLNFADVEKCRGNYPNAPEPPFVPGMEAAGRITALGGEADSMAGHGTDLAVGDRVAVLGREAFAERMVVDADRVFPIPEGLSAPQAAAVPVQWFTAHNCLHEWGGLAADETVLVHAAAGGVGSAAVQLAAEAGATVVGTASTAEKLSFAADRGADVTVNYEDEDVTAAVEQALGESPVDLVLDGVGGRAFKTGVELLDDAGRVVTYGMASGRPGTVATPRLLFENKAVVGYHLEHALEHAPERVRTAVEPVFDALAEGRAEAHVDARVPLSEVADAYDRLASRESRGKVVVEP